MARTLFEHLFADAPEFDFFQAVRLLERLFPDKKPVGREALPPQEVVRFRSHLSLAFPPSALYSIEQPNEDRPYLQMVQTFFGLTGPSGMLPRHYTQTLLDLGRDVKGPERRSLGDWFALFDHRLVSLFYRAWEKYRFWIPYERGEAFLHHPDQFTSAVLSLAGLGMPSVRNRLRVAVPTGDYDEPERKLSKIDDLGLLYYAGMFAQRPRNAVSLAAILGDYFDLPLEVQQFRGQWLALDRADQTCLGMHGVLGVDAVAGERVWDVQAKFRVRVGPVNRGRFEEFLPDRTIVERRKSLFAFAQMIRFYVGPELDFDVQLVLAAAEVPPTKLGGEGFGSRLGWNTWITSRAPSRNADDAVFDVDEAVWLN